MSVVGRETLGQRIKAFRVSKGIRQVDLAERAGISWRHLIRIEQDAGGATKTATIARIAEALDVKASELSSGSDEDDEEAEPVAFGDVLQRMFERAIDAAVERKLSSLEPVDRNAVQA